MAMRASRHLGQTLLNFYFLRDPPSTGSEGNRRTSAEGLPEANKKTPNGSAAPEKRLLARVRRTSVCSSTKDGKPEHAV